MRAVPCRTPNRGSLVLGIAAAIALIVSPCSSTSATGSVGTFADHSGGLEDSVRDDVRALVGQFDEVVNQLSEFQERSALLAGELEKRASENERLVRALESAMPSDAKEIQGLRQREMLASMGLTGEMAIDSGPAASQQAGTLSQDAEIGSSPASFMETVDTPARLRGGGGSSGAVGVDAILQGGRRRSRRCESEAARPATAGMLAARLTLTLRGGGNMLSLGSKYSPQQRTLNKQLCGAVKRGDEREIRRLVREGADPSYGDCDMLGFSALHHAVNTRQMKSLEVLQQLGGDVHLKDGLGWTLMHQAAHNADQEAVERLQRYGVSVLVKNNAGRLPADVTKAAGNTAPYRECYKKLLAMQEFAQGAKKAAVQQVVEAAARNEDPEDDDDEEEEPQQQGAAGDSKDKK